jgi:hypothetical protein
VGNKNATILVLNGKHYDALTGKPVTAGPGKAVRPIDDMVGGRRAKPAKQQATAQPKLPATPIVASSTKSMDVMRTPQHLVHHKQQRAATLVRSTVNKPGLGLKRQLKTVSGSQLPANIPSTVIVPKFPVAEINPKRLTRAEHVAKSELIHKFAPGMPEFGPSAAAVKILPVSEVQPLPPSEHKSHELFERAIASATSHEQPYVDQKKLAKTAKKQAKHASKVAKRKPHHHLASVVAASFAVLAIGGFVALQNKADLTLRFADAKAGFHASVPDYQPAGYGLNKFTYSAGNVSLGFNNNDAGRGYTIHQQTTKWDSQALLDNFVTANYQSYQILQSGNQIIYMYGHGDAAWVKGGIWYQLTSGGNLSNSQVLNIATSV